MSSRVQKRTAEARFRPSNAGPSRSGQATAISMPSASQPSNEGRAQQSASDAPTVTTDESIEPQQAASVTPSKQVGRPIAIPTPISTPSNIGTPRPLPKRVTPGPPSGSNPIRRPSAAPSSSTSSFAVNSSPASRPKGTLISTPIAAPGSSRGKSIERPGSLVRSTPTPSFPRSASRPPPAAESSSSKRKDVGPTPENAPSSEPASETQKKTRVRRQSDASTQRKKPPRGSRPAKPASAYTLYSREHRSEVEERAASASGRTFDVNAAIRKDWQALSHEDREPYVKQAEQLQKEHEIAMEAFHEIYGRSDSEEDDDAATASPSKKGSQPSKDRSGQPAAPKNAYLIFRSEYEQSGKGKKGSGAISTAWHALSETERASYRSKAEEAKREWEIAMAQWKENNSDDSDEESEESDGTGTKKRSSKRKAAKRPKKPTISDDEAEYHGSQNDDAAKEKLDNRSATMLDLSQLRFNHGRASAKTFELARKHRNDKRERVKMRKQMRLHNLRTEQELTALVGPGANGSNDAPNTNGAQGADHGAEDDAQAQQSEHSDAESIVNDGHTSATDGEDGAQSDAESVGAASTSTHHTLREKKFSIRTRIVDGKIVLDESSLQQSRNDDAGYGAQNEMIDINESDRFVNSSSHAKSRPRNDRWNVEETKEFLKAVSMWGSDFEMIARMFPSRNRSQIRAKWRSMERTDSHSLDLAFKRRLPVNLDEYARLAGVDLSGEAPAIELPTFNIKKANEDDEDMENIPPIKRGDEEEEPVGKVEQIQYDEDGLEIVDEGDDLDQQNRAPTLTRSKRRTPAGDMPPPSAARQTPGEEREMPRTKRMRSSSLASQAGTAVSGTTSASNVHGASSAAASDRERKQRRIQEEQRKQRERARRRPRPDDDGVEILEEGD
ncbi:uncharacterized protein FA14DRAFT_159332 [Meira miltonrushii]|uniref:HMG box domain-containing protein n=1 Tax=Meira miltonrushii TaxID=1280837 RepID=A0A316VHT6_9BASI|nr:uncharacterized protein FA14DRAFT_159332 [Meira miltonrushii]PWN37152.1 hypothetical protein FA14DRAFT_159332 [Meira miltonrushii]